MTVVAAQRVVTPDGVLAPGWVEFGAAGIVGVAAGEGPAGVVEVPWLVPGFVDMHCHGGGGASFESAEPAQVAQAAAAHLRHGSTSVVASLVSAAPDVLVRQVRDLAELCDDGVVVGVHLEGPWLSPDYAGAHDPAALRDPSVAELDVLLAAGRGHVRMLTLAPERAGALEVIRTAVAQGVTVAIGHTNATYPEVAAAVEAGATVASHLFNAMRPLRHRDPGPVAALTEDPRVTAELIADGVHLDPAMLRLGARAASGRIALVTDAMSAAGSPDGTYWLGGSEVLVVKGVARLVDGGAIAGSTLTMDTAVRHVVDSGAADAVGAIRAATQVPARAVSLDGVGQLATGRRADLVALTDDLEVTGVWRAGVPVAA